MAKNTKVADKPGLDPTLPDVELVVAGKTYKLAFDFNAVCVAEKETGLNLFKSIVSEFTATSLRGLLFASLLKDQPDITVEHAGGLITLENLTIVRQAIVTAWYGSIKADEGKE